MTSHNIVDRTSLRNKINLLDELIDVQMQNGVWNRDRYDCGLTNGLLLAKSVLVDQYKPEFKTLLT